MSVISAQRPEVLSMAPHCAPWSQMSNINDRATREEKRKRYYPMLEFCQVAICQIAHGRKFIVENPAGSMLWWTQCLNNLLSKQAVKWSTLHMCAFGMHDPSGHHHYYYYYYYYSTSLTHIFAEGVLDPVF